MAAAAAAAAAASWQPLVCRTTPERACVEDAGDGWEWAGYGVLRGCGQSHEDDRGAAGVEVDIAWHNKKLPHSLHT